ncbi:MAG TPA: hypothetical protein VMR46_03315 [Candidatus Paceibacterota bacterium]|nr:hypothetical protein [Candidatus Paceibacterota bacterium]
MDKCPNSLGLKLRFSKRNRGDLIGSGFNSNSCNNGKANSSSGNVSSRAKGRPPIPTPSSLYPIPEGTKPSPPLAYARGFFIKLAKNYIGRSYVCTKNVAK